MMLRHKLKGLQTALPLNDGRPRLETAEPESVDGILSELEKMNAKAIEELNGKKNRGEASRMCSYGCSCPPCLAGRCDLHGMSYGKFSEYLNYEAALRPPSFPIDPGLKMDFTPAEYLRWDLTADEKKGK